jgi:hypothetical protein
MKILYFFLYLWFIFALLDPDPAAQINPDPSGSRSTTLLSLFSEEKSGALFPSTQSPDQTLASSASQMVLVTPSYVPDEVGVGEIDGEMNGESDEINEDDEYNSVEGEDKAWLLMIPPAADMTTANAGENSAARGGKKKLPRRGGKKRRAKADISSPAETRWSVCQYCDKPVRAPYIHVFRNNSIPTGYLKRFQI